MRTDNGPEFCGRALLTWAHEHGVLLRLIEPRKPTQNAFIELFNGRFRDECLNEQRFTSLAHAQAHRSTRSEAAASETTSILGSGRGHGHPPARMETRPDSRLSLNCPCQDRRRGEIVRWVFDRNGKPVKDFSHC